MNPEPETKPNVLTISGKSVVVFIVTTALLCAGGALFFSKYNLAAKRADADKPAASATESGAAAAPAPR